MRITGIRGDEFTALCFAWVGRIVEPRRKGLQRGFAFADVHGNNSSNGDRHISFLKVKKAVSFETNSSQVKRVKLLFQFLLPVGTDQKWLLG